MAAAVVCATAIMTPQNAASETERLIAAALYHGGLSTSLLPATSRTGPCLGPRRRSARR
jgi:indolepyruvate decarboxylase